MRLLPAPIRVATLLHDALIAAAFMGTAQAADFDTAVKPYFAENCLTCHDARKQKGDLRLDTLPVDFVSEKNAGHWTDILDRLTSGDMPPEKEPRPKAKDTAAVVDWISSQLAEAESARHATSERVSFRKLTRDEYVNTIHDLLGVTYDASSTMGMGEDPSWLGFERIGSVLSFAPAHIEKYLTAAQQVLNEALPSGPKPASKVIHWDPFGMREAWNGVKKDFERQGNAAAVRVPIIPSSNAVGVVGKRLNLAIPTTGVYLLRLKLSGLHPAQRLPPRLRIYEADIDSILAEQDVDAPEDRPLTLEFRVHLTAGSHDIDVMNAVPGLAKPIQDSNHAVFTSLHARMPWQQKLTDDADQPLRPFLLLDYVEWEGPLCESWPTAAQRQIFGEGNRDAAQARDIVTRFATRAFRQTAAREDIDRYAQLVDAELKAGKAFEPAVKTALAAILCAPNFLYLVEGSPARATTTLSDDELAARLSYFLWSTLPDEGLRALAVAGKLHDAATLRGEVRRMLKDPRAAAFAEEFPRQWLQLRRVGMFAPDKALYPDYDDYLQKSMIAETTGFFHEVLAKNLSLRNFLDSDWTMLNQRLALHYGISGVTGEAMQRVALRPEDHRGGLMTQAALLALTSDGTRHRPVHRGKWLSESILGRAVPPPPANVPAIKAAQAAAPKTSLRDKLAAHLENASCAACHRKIDPLGLAFENYDAIGRWRTEEAVRDGSGANPKVDASGELADGRKFADVAAFKRLMLDDCDKFAAAFTEKLATFAMRRVMVFSDRAEIQRIAAASKADDYRLATLVETLVTSALFQQR
jgi:mono/diheme cytochrome c family protein